MCWHFLHANTNTSSPQRVANPHACGDSAYCPQSDYIQRLRVYLSCVPHAPRKTWTDLGADLADKPLFRGINIQQAPLPTPWTDAHGTSLMAWWSRTEHVRLQSHHPFSLVSSLLLRRARAWLPWHKLSGWLAYGVTSIWVLKAGDCFCGADVGGRSSGTADSFKQLGTVCDPHKGKWPSACSCQAGARNRACPLFAHLIFGGAYLTSSVQGIFKQWYSVCINKDI